MDVQSLNLFLNVRRVADIQHIRYPVKRLSASPGCDLRVNRRFLPSAHRCQWDIDHARHSSRNIIQRNRAALSPVNLEVEQRIYRDPTTYSFRNTQNTSHVYRQNARVLWASHNELLPFIKEHATYLLCFRTLQLLFIPKRIILHVIKDGYDWLFVLLLSYDLFHSNTEFSRTYVKTGRTSVFQTVPSKE